jgi:hypothetical protein
MIIKFVAEVPEDFTCLDVLHEALEITIEEGLDQKVIGSTLETEDESYERGEGVREENRSIYDIQQLLFNKTYSQIEKETISSDETLKMISSCCEVRSTNKI